MDHKCPFCLVSIPEEVYHDHYRKCKEITPKVDQNPLPNQNYVPTHPPPPYSVTTSNAHLWKCASCDLNFACRAEFQEHLQSPQHKEALALSNNGDSNGYRIPNPPSANIIDALNAGQPNATQPPMNNSAAQAPRSEEEIRLIVRSELAKYLQQFLQIVRNDVPRNPP